jgi:Uma2 family endonuclease
MTALKSDKMTVDEFLEWCLTQEERYELVDGVPQMMTGARRLHDRVVRRALIALDGRLRGGPCEPFTDDIALITPKGQVRRADVLVDCGPMEDDDLRARSPVLVIEVLSKSTRQMDLLRKTAEYKTVPSMRYILLLDPDEVAAIFHVRQADGRWEDTPIIGRDTDIHMPEINVSLTLGEFYEGLSL